MFAAAAEAHSYALLIAGVVTSVIAAFFYLKVILTMYAAEDEQEVPDELETASPGPAIGMPVVAVLAVCVVMTIWVGVLPTIIIDFARDATLVF